MRIFNQLIQGILVIWGIVSLLFVIFYGLGDPTSFLVGDQADEATKASVRQKYGLDQPIAVQYFSYLNGLSPLGWLSEDAGKQTRHISLLRAGTGTISLKSPDLGRSFQSNQAVTPMISSRLEGTMILALSAIVFASVLGIGLGMLAAMKRDSWWDRGILSLSVLGISAPSFFIGVLIAWLFAVVLRDWTGLNVTGHIFEEKVFEPGREVVLKNLLLPALSLGIRPLAIFIQLTRSSMLDVLNTDYVRTARAKGLPQRTILFRHALRNALNPVITSITGWLASLLAGAFFIEYIFNWQGIGKLMIDALEKQDLPVILGTAIFIGVVFVGITILTDASYRLLDPRVRLD
jgi:peptide/nickel transport system permease protein